MLSIVANILYVLIAIAMVVLILLQRGAGANAGSGFGGGASATVFGARGSANFLSRSTAVLAGLFFLLSLGIGIYLSRSGVDVRPTDDLGVMSGVTVPANPTPTTPVNPAPTKGKIQIGDVPPATSPEGADKPAAAAASAPEAATTAAGGDKPVATRPDEAKPGKAGPAKGGPAKGGKDGK